MTPLILLALGTALAGPVDAKVSASNDTTVDIEIACGKVHVLGWDKPALHVSGKAIELELDQGGSRVEVTAVDYLKEECPELRIQAPAKATLRFEGRSTDVTIENVTGRVDVELISGDVQVSGSPDTVQIEVISGTVQFRGPMNRVDVETVSGDINATDPTGRLILESVSGDISLTGGRVDRLDIETVSGDVALSTAYGSDAAVDCHFCGCDSEPSFTHVVHRHESLVLDCVSNECGCSDSLCKIKSRQCPVLTTANLPSPLSSCHRNIRLGNLA